MHVRPGARLAGGRPVLGCLLRRHYGVVVGLAEGVALEPPDCLGRGPFDFGAALGVGLGGAENVV